LTDGHQPYAKVIRSMNFNGPLPYDEASRGEDFWGHSPKRANARLEPIRVAGGEGRKRSLHRIPRPRLRNPRRLPPNRQLLAQHQRASEITRCERSRLRLFAHAHSPRPLVFQGCALPPGRSTRPANRLDQARCAMTLNKDTALMTWCPSGECHGRSGEMG
jgi:hypothetical protein